MQRNAGIAPGRADVRAVLHRSHPAAAAALCGFSLLELLTVLAIVALITALVGPRITDAMLDPGRATDQAVDVKLRELPLRLFLAGDSIELGSDPQRNAELLGLPEGARASAQPAIFVSSLGTCTQGVLSVAWDGGRVDYQVGGPGCAVRRL
jgi:prepilin-type N-terminal cleavage/methylation domain-containing protein